MALDDLKVVITDFGKQASSYVPKQIVVYIWYACILGLLIIVGWTGLWLYKAHRAGKDATAQHLFAQNLEYFTQAQSHQENALSWEQIENKFQEGYEQQRSTNIAPYFLAYKAQAQLFQGKKTAALETLSIMLQNLDNQSPLYIPYKTELALIKIDSADQTVATEGLQELQQLAADIKNPYRDQSLFYLGNYYQAHNDMAKAKDAWQQLIADFVKPGQTGSSLYIERARELLNNG